MPWLDCTARPRPIWRQISGKTAPETKVLAPETLVLALGSGLEKSAAIRPFATKKSRLASERTLLVDSLATESCCLADRLATKLFQSGQRR